MVTLKGDARMQCESPGCVASVPVLMCLMVTGGFAFKPAADIKDWQVRAPNNGGPFSTFCPEHKVTVEPVRSVIEGVR